MLSRNSSCSSFLSRSSFLMRSLTSLVELEGLVELPGLAEDPGLEFHRQPVVRLLLDQAVEDVHGLVGLALLGHGQDHALEHFPLLAVDGLVALDLEELAAQFLDLDELLAAVQQADQARVGGAEALTAEHLNRLVGVQVIEGFAGLGLLQFAGHGGQDEGRIGPEGLGLLLGHLDGDPDQFLRTGRVLEEDQHLPLEGVGPRDDIEVEAALAQVVRLGRPGRHCRAHAHHEGQATSIRAGSSSTHSSFDLRSGPAIHPLRRSRQDARPPAHRIQDGRLTPLEPAPWQPAVTFPVRQPIAASGISPRLAGGSRFPPASRGLSAGLRTMLQEEVLRRCCFPSSAWLAGRRHGRRRSAARSCCTWRFWAVPSGP